MKRGLIAWDRARLPREALEARLESFERVCDGYDVPALVVYSDVWRSNDARYVSNYMPYWNRALIVVPRGGKPILLCSLSPRVYPWIKSVTLHEEILPSPNLPSQLAKIAAGRGWTRVGIVDFAGLPHELHAPLAAGSLAIVDVPRSALRPAPTESEVAMHRHAAKLARQTLADALGPGALGATDHVLAGRLELALRRAGAEDLVVLVSDGTTPPLPARGARIGDRSSAAVALEWSGHWVKVARNVAGLTSPLPPAPGSTARHETVWEECLSGSYPWEAFPESAPVERAIVSVQVELRSRDARLYYGDTCLRSPEGLAPL
ncbi:MAG TPA: hypothetical protein VEV18_07885 [Steroidobacteraceae bacterium]|nr:hypothetical protein [Steroidobacteraceae bacterium]